MGSQDQVAVAYGGLNRICFSTEDDFSVSPLALSEERLRLLENHLMLVFTGFSRNASEIAGGQIEAMSKNRRQLMAMDQEEARRYKEYLDRFERR